MIPKLPLNGRIYTLTVGRIPICTRATLKVRLGSGLSLLLEWTTLSVPKGLAYDCKTWAYSTATNTATLLAKTMYSIYFEIQIWELATGCHTNVSSPTLLLISPHFKRSVNVHVRKVSINAQHASPDNPELQFYTILPGLWNFITNITNSNGISQLTLVV